MGILRNELIPARHVGFTGRISIGGSGHSDTCTFVFSQQLVRMLSGLPDGEWSPVMRGGESTTGIVLYPACVTCIGNEFRLSTDNTVVFFDNSLYAIVRKISTEFHYELWLQAMEQATTESDRDDSYDRDDRDDYDRDDYDRDDRDDYDRDDYDRDDYDRDDYDRDYIGGADRADRADRDDIGGNDIGGDYIGGNDIGGNDRDDRADRDDIGGDDIGGNDIGGNDIGGNDRADRDDIGGDDIGGDSYRGQTSAFNGHPDYVGEFGSIV